MIYHKFKVIFLHVPRTGGTSIMNKFKSLNVKLDKERSHKNWKYYIDVYGKDVFQEYFKFAVIRNPYQKVFSSYCFRPRGYKDFTKWLEWIVTLRDKNRNHILGSHFVWIGNKIITDDLIRFENFQNDWKRICNKIGIDSKIRHLNSSNLSQRNYRNYYTNKAKKIVEKYFYKDIEYFKYKF